MGKAAAGPYGFLGQCRQALPQEPGRVGPFARGHLLRRSGDDVVAKYEYDGLSRRVKKHIDTDETPGVDTYRYFYYSSRWQVLEMRYSSSEKHLCST